MQPEEARFALDQVHNADLQLAEKVGHCPPWRHAAFAALKAALIGSITVSSTVQLIAIPFILLGVYLLLQSDRKRYGMFINGYRRGATLWVTLGFVAVMIGQVVAAMYMQTEDFSPLSKIALTGIAFGFAVAFSVKWQRVFRRELTGK